MRFEKIEIKIDFLNPCSWSMHLYMLFWLKCLWNISSECNLLWSLNDFHYYQPLPSNHYSYKDHNLFLMSKNKFQLNVLMYVCIYNKTHLKSFNLEQPKQRNYPSLENRNHILYSHSLFARSPKLMEQLLN